MEKKEKKLSSRGPIISKQCLSPLRKLTFFAFHVHKWPKYHWKKKGEREKETFALVVHCLRCCLRWSLLALRFTIALHNPSDPNNKVDSVHVIYVFFP